MSTLDVSFFWAAFLAFGLSSLVHLVFLVTGKKTAGMLASIVTMAAFLILTVAIISRSFIVGHLPVTNMYEYLSFFAWSAGLFYFIFVIVFNYQIIGVFISPVIFMLIASASLLPKQPSEQLIPALQSLWLQIHVTLAALGEAAFGVAFAANVMYVFKLLFIKRTPFSRLPSLESIDLLSYKAIVIGYPLFTIGALFAGAIWAEQAWGSFWSWDPKEVNALIVWLIYTLYLHLRLLGKWRGIKSALISILGFQAALLTLFSNLFVGGLHAYP